VVLLRMDRASFINFIGKVPIVNVLLRDWARGYRDGSVVTIGSGFAEGMKWRRRKRYVNGYWLGHYELPLQQCLARVLKEGHVFYDVGANAGFFTLIASKLTGPQGRCLAIDPSPHNAAVIQDIVALNALTNCQVLQEAVADEARKALFSFSAPGSPTGHLGAPASAEDAIEVQVTTLDDLCSRFGAPDVVKMDIEGAEDRALAGARTLLKNKRPVWIIELHGNERASAVRDLLGAAGYSFSTIAGVPVDAGQPLPHHVVASP
jgi:FkbM family methyltransferase